jgi:hypothetical protein
MTTFYVVSAGAAATLVGLLFVAVQIGPPLTTRGAITRRHAMARSTFAVFAVLFALSLYLLLPYQPTNVRAEVAIAAGAVGVFRAIRTWLPVWADKLQGRIEFRLWQTAWLLIGPIIAYVFIAIAGIEQLLVADPTAIDKGVTPWFILLFVIGIRNSWNLLVEGSSSDVPPEPSGKGEAQRVSTAKPPTSSVRSE